MKKILDQITEIVGNAFKQCGYDDKYGKTGISNRPDLCEYQCNGAMAAAAGGDPEKEEDGKEWDAKNPDWNRVVIIPVKAVSNSNNEIVEISNSLGMESAMLKGGTNPENKLKMQIFYTTF